MRGSTSGSSVEQRGSFATTESVFYTPKCEWVSTNSTGTLTWPQVISTPYLSLIPSGGSLLRSLSSASIRLTRDASAYVKIIECAERVKLRQSPGTSTCRDPSPKLEYHGYNTWLFRSWWNVSTWLIVSSMMIYRWYLKFYEIFGRRRQQETLDVLDDWMICWVHPHQKVPKDKDLLHLILPRCRRMLEKGRHKARVLQPSVYICARR